MLLKKFNAYIASNQLFQQQNTLLLAVSGGLDSVVLCELCKQAQFDFSIAHCNFNLRGNESERDEQFVKKLAESYGVKLFVKHFDTAVIASQQKKSIETTARELRYHWFAQLVHPATNQPFQHIVTAHHADDNIETVVMNFFRGTGIAGVRGMLPLQGKITRPLLFARRTELEEFAAINGLHFVVDSTNAANDYTRNLFRNKILPLINEVYPGADKNILTNIQRFSATELLYQEVVQLHKKKLLEKKGAEWHVPVLKLSKIKGMQSVLYEIIKDFGFTAHQTGDVAALLQSETGKYVASASHRIIKNRHWLIIAPVQTTAAHHILIEASDSVIVFEKGRINLTHTNSIHVQGAPLDASPSTALIDATDIRYPLLLRKWKQGDYFYPLGMQKKKKLSRFFIDQKLSMLQKENTWVIEMNKKIIWVVGMRIDDRFKINPNTTNILQLTLAQPEDLA